ncbi:[acyl-carrier-protein] S-malonyltransferase [Saccharobesus litoralis]|uniref:[acyl-carrier-protein] S-malonyltransferase n=1 Tax=Saccharobesus litoralis TaxID=2172099 RepID=A0A2S0VN95_9ALTE|nr:ACP S-malonyltransferase [Saccharobesus litoralis]AWB65698.1 [acyl-carrier-protein] S-malonyltransferase [Saccharobesus litoralis]
MSQVFVFPGQGSQHVGMGEALFERYPDWVLIADEILGYSIVELCLQDPNGVLNQTQYTQPALFFVSALQYHDYLQNGGQQPDYLAGHSLGEYAALYAAGAFDLATGLKLVQKRGELMAQAPKGAMAAVMSLPLEQVVTTLQGSQFNGIDIANINSREQIIVSGLFDDIGAAESLFSEQGARYVPLKVSAAFHSRYMASVATEFAEFAKQFAFKPLQLPVVANVTARPYPEQDYFPLLQQQIAGSVLWYESVSWLLDQGYKEFEEIGPGMVLSKMVRTIKDTPMAKSQLNLLEQQRAKQISEQRPVLPASQRKNLLMFAGQGSQYFGMAQELYQYHPEFKRQLELCDQAFIELAGYSLIDEIYQSPASDEFDYLASSHPAIYCVSYALYQTLLAEGIKPDAVLGHSLGEFVAATVAGVFDFTTGLKLVVKQAQLLEQKAEKGAMMSVMTDQQTWQRLVGQRPDVYIAGVNHQGNLLISGDRQALSQIQASLSSTITDGQPTHSQSIHSQSIHSQILPVQYAFHSNAIKAIESEYLAELAKVEFNDPAIALHSCLSQAQVEQFTPEHLWQVISEPVHFISTVNAIDIGQFNLIDMSATGSLASLVKHGVGDSRHVKAFTLINQFGRNRETLQQTVELLAD